MYIYIYTYIHIYIYIICVCVCPYVWYIYIMISYVDVCDICVDCHIIKRWLHGMILSSSCHETNCNLGGILRFETSPYPFYIGEIAFLRMNFIEFPSLCSNRYDKDRLHMFSIMPFILWWTNILPCKITIFNWKIHYFYGHFPLLFVGSPEGKYNFPPKAQMVDNPGNWGHYVDKKCPFTGPQPRLMVWGSTTWKSQKKLWYILSCVIYDILYILYKFHVFYDFAWCIWYAFYGIDIWYILWCCMSCIGVCFFSLMIYNIH